MIEYYYVYKGKHRTETGQYKEIRGYTIHLLRLHATGKTKDEWSYVYRTLGVPLSDIQGPFYTYQNAEREVNRQLRLELLNVGALSYWNTPITDVHLTITVSQLTEHNTAHLDIRNMLNAVIPTVGVVVDGLHCIPLPDSNDTYMICGDVELATEHVSLLEDLLDALQAMYSGVGLTFLYGYTIYGRSTDG